VVASTDLETLLKIGSYFTGLNTTPWWWCSGFHGYLKCGTRGIREIAPLCSPLHGRIKTCHLCFMWSLTALDVVNGGNQPNAGVRCGPCMWPPSVGSMCNRIEGLHMLSAGSGCNQVTKCLPHLPPSPACWSSTAIQNSKPLRSTEG